MADLSGLTDALSEALAPICKRRRRHDPGRVLVDLAVTIAGGGDALSHPVSLPHQPGGFRALASGPPAFRVVGSIGGSPLAPIRAAPPPVPRSVLAAGPHPAT